jgi:hypothetical protein
MYHAGARDEQLMRTFIEFHFPAEVDPRTQIVITKDGRNQHGVVCPALSPVFGLGGSLFAWRVAGATLFWSARELVDAARGSP